MKPRNTRPAIDIGDGAPVRCMFWARSDVPPSFREECESASTEILSGHDVENVLQWLDSNPHRIIGVRPGVDMYFCDTHIRVIRAL